MDDDINTEQVSEEALYSAEMLLEAYKAQDKRMDHLLDGELGKAKDAEVEALSSAYKAFRTAYDSSEAGQVGATLMNALFIQDDIENWDRPEDGNLKQQVRNRASDEEDVTYYLWLPRIKDSYEPADDWEILKNYLRDEWTDIDEGLEAAAESRVEFFKKHPNGEYKSDVVDTVNETVSALSESGKQEIRDGLGQIFLNVLEAHDDGNIGKDEKIDVARYYEAIREL